MPPPDAVADAAVALLEHVRASLPLDDDLVRFAGIAGGGAVNTGFLSAWDPACMDGIPARMHWASPEQVQLAVWRRANDDDPTVVIGVRIGTALFAFMADCYGQVIASHDARQPTDRSVNLFLITMGMDRPLLGGVPNLMDAETPNQ